MAVLGTIAGGVGTTTTVAVQWCPEYLYFTVATVPTAIKVTVAGDGVICDLDGAGITSKSRTRMIGSATNGYYLPLANGFIKNKNVQIAITNAVAGAFTLYGNSRGYGNKYVVSETINVNALTGVTITMQNNTICASFPNAVTLTDNFNVTYKDGYVETLDFVEVCAMLGLTQNTVGTLALMDNFVKNIVSINFRPALAQNIYLQKVRPVGNFAQSIIL